MDRLTAVSAQASEATTAPASAPLLDLRHLDHQTLGDASLRRIVLNLFLDEAPQYAANLRAADDRKAWRMAVHTLKGVALNIGAFPLAWQCKDYEALDVQTGTIDQQAAVDAIASLIDGTVATIRTTLRA